MLKKCILLLAVSMLLFLFVSCAGKSKNTSAATSTIESTTGSTGESTSTDEKKEPESTPAPTPEPNNDYLLMTNGLRPFAVMIDNEGTKSLPQGGLDKAQIIYEVIVEGGETRLMPVFWGTDPKMIGSVRSSRHYFLDYAMEHDAIYVHFGWSPMAMKDISSFKINNINGVANGGEIFWDLTKDRKNWQDSYTSMEKIKGYVEKAKYRTKTDKKPVFEYNSADVEPAGGQKAEKISMRYSSSYTCGYTYDTAAKTYKRLRKGQPQIERVSGKQLEAKNIIIQYVPNHTIKGDNAGRQEVKTVGSGSGFLITDGKAVKLKWSKSARTAPTKYTDEAGNSIKLNPGQTWVQVLPVEGKVTIE